jgi:hypothetical protein
MLLAREFRHFMLAAEEAATLAMVEQLVEQAVLVAVAQVL